MTEECEWKSLQQYADEINYLIRQGDEAAAKDPNVIKHRLSAGRDLFEASLQMSYEEFGPWVKRHFWDKYRLTEIKARKLIDAWQRAEPEAVPPIILAYRKPTTGADDGAQG
jgi:hypothetical protein